MLCAWLISMPHCFRLFTFNSVRYNKWTPTTIPTLLVTGYSKYTYVHDCDVSFDAKIYVCCKLCVLLQRCTKTRRWTCRTTRASWPSRPANATIRGTSSRYLRQRQHYALLFSLNLLHFSWAVCLWDLVPVMYSYRLYNVQNFTMYPYVTSVAQCISIIHNVPMQVLDILWRWLCTVQQLQGAA